MSYVDKINIFNLTRTAKQTITLYFSQILALIFGVLFTILNTRYLSQKDFGTLNFYIQVLTFISLIFEFGFFAAGTRLIAIQKTYQKERELIGSLIIIGALLSFCFMILIFIISFFVDPIFKSEIRYLLIIGLIPATAFPIQYMLQLIFQGSNEVVKLSLYNVLPRMLYFILALIAIIYGWFNLEISAMMYISTLFTITVIMLFLTRAKFIELKENLSIIIKETKEYGFQVYLGRVAGMMGYQSNILLIQYFVQEIQVANYSLVNFFTNPISIFSRSLCTSLYKGFANQKEIPKRVFYINYLWLLLSSVVYILIGGFVLELLFSQKYSEAIPLIIPLTIANIFNGLFQPYNFFLSAKGEGKYLRNTAFLLTITTIGFNVILIPLWSSYGAAIATVIALGINYIAHIFYYRRSLKKNNFN